MSFRLRSSSRLLAILLAYSLPVCIGVVHAGGPPNTPTSATIEQANAMILKGKSQEAVDLLTDLLGSKSGTPDERDMALLCRSRAFSALKKTDAALGDLQKIVHSSTAAHSTKTSALLRLIAIHSVERDHKSIASEATQLLDSADEKELVTSGFSRSFVLGTRALSYLVLNEPAKALADCNEALSDPHLVGSRQMLVYHIRASAYFSLDRNAEAANDFRRVVDNADTAPNIRADSRKYLDLIRERQTTRPATQPATKE